MTNEVKLFLEGEEIDSRDFSDIDNAVEFAETYPLDEFCDHVEVWGEDAFGDYDVVYGRDLIPDC